MGRPRSVKVSSSREALKRKEGDGQSRLEPAARTPVRSSAGYHEGRSRWRSRPSSPPTKGPRASHRRRSGRAHHQGEEPSRIRVKTRAVQPGRPQRLAQLPRPRPDPPSHQTGAGLGQTRGATHQIRAGDVVYTPAPTRALARAPSRRPSWLNLSHRKEWGTCESPRPTQRHVTDASTTAGDVNVTRALMGVACDVVHDERCLERESPAERCKIWNRRACRREVEGLRV